MDLVLGLSMTSADVRWVLVEGTTAEGATICRDAVVDTLEDVIAAVGNNRLHAIGVTWTDEAESAASSIVEALAARAMGKIIKVSRQQAADRLAMGIADHGGYRDVAVCIVDADDAMVTLVDAERVTTERVDPTAEDMLATLDRSGARPEAIYVLGSADDLDAIAACFHGAAVPVITAAEADLALARGAALASALTVNSPMARPARWQLPSKAGALTSVVAAAAVVFVASASAALGLGLTPHKRPTVAQRNSAATSEQPLRAPAAPTLAKAAPPPIPARLPVAKTIVEAAKPAPAAVPAPEPPAAPAPQQYVPPPAYQPPAPAPNYVPPAPKPRLRDRIIERIPIINRFHTPHYP